MKQPIFAVGIFLFFILVFYVLDSEVATQSPLYVRYIPSKVIYPNNEVLSLLKTINTKNSRIKNIVCTDVQIRAKGLPFQLKSTLLFEKEKNFRMIVKSIFGKELDIGSNDDQFWFWSKRMNPPALYFSAHKDLYKTRLKTPFHPLLLMESLSINKIKTDQVKFYKNDKYLLLEEEWTSPMNVPVIKKILIDLNLGAIKGHYLYDDGGLVASAEIKKISNGLPSEIIIIWYEENIAMSWKLDNLRINQMIDPNYWKLPNYRKTINMGKN